MCSILLIFFPISVATFPASIAAFHISGVVSGRTKHNPSLEPTIEYQEFQFPCCRCPSPVKHPLARNLTPSTYGYEQSLNLLFHLRRQLSWPPATFFSLHVTMN